MKPIFCLIVAFIIIFSMTSCESNWDSMNLNDPIAIPQDGIISQTILTQMKNENAIGIFQGTYESISYEWTIFGAEINIAKDINLLASIENTSDGYIQVILNQDEAFGFSALLSITLQEKWQAQSATAYTEDKTVTGVSITGNKNTILNLSLDGTVKKLEIRPDALMQDAILPDSNEDPSHDTTASNVETDNYLSKPQESDDTVYTDGKDKYQTDPIPEGKPKPVEPEDQTILPNKTYTCTFSIECATILNNLSMLDPEKLEMVPSGGVILSKTIVTFNEGESVFDVLQRLCKEKNIHIESSWTPIYNSAYIEGIHNLYEFDCGALSGWMYQVNGWYPNYGCSRYQLKDGDVVQWRYTCDLGNDIGGGYAVGG